MSEGNRSIETAAEAHERGYITGTRAAWSYIRPATVFDDNASEGLGDDNE